MKHAAAGVFVLTFVAGCAPDAQQAAVADPASDGIFTEADIAAAPEWSVEEMPSLQIGVVAGDDAYQLHQIVGSVLLPAGGVAVMNGGSDQLRIYDSAGRFVSATGRDGEGPGEFRNAARLYRWGDTLAVYDAGAARLSLHALDGTFLSTRWVDLQPGRFSLDEWLTDWSWVDGPPLGAGRTEVLAALSRLPQPDSSDGFRYVRVSPYGHLWVRQSHVPSGAQAWVVHDLTGRPIGRVETPALFEVQEFGADYLLGRGRDSLDVEYVRLYGLDIPGVPLRRHAFSAPETSGPAARTRHEDYRTLQGVLRNMAALQEIFYSKDYQYSTDPAELELELPDGVTIRVVRASDRGWVGVAIAEASGRMCGMSSGTPIPVGWMPGTVSCL
ncbi:MAG: hypothetical protein WEF86_00105 [Gemmatimonadota bacterium]